MSAGGRAGACGSVSASIWARVHATRSSAARVVPVARTPAPSTSALFESRTFTTPERESVAVSETRTVPTTAVAAPPSMTAVPVGPTLSTMNVPVVAVGVGDSEAEMVALAETGIVGYVTHGASVDELVQVIETASRGELICSPRLAAALVRRLATLAADHEPQSSQQIDLTLSAKGDSLTLVVADDGWGFDPGGVRNNGGLGLVSIEERARLVKGQVTIRSGPQKGTTFSVRVPLEAGALYDARVPA